MDRMPIRREVVTGIASLAGLIFSMNTAKKIDELARSLKRQVRRKS